MNALRHNKGKPQLHYVDTFSDALDEVARVWEYGSSKYPAYNYMKGAERATESYNSARRHMKKWLQGVDYDEEAAEKGWQLHHIALAAGNLLRLLQELKDFPERDDRPCKILEREKAAQPQELVKRHVQEHISYYEQRDQDPNRDTEKQPGPALDVPSRGTSRRGSGKKGTRKRARAGKRSTESRKR